MKPPKFHVGQAVVLANGRANLQVWPTSGEKLPERGPIYHVREVTTRLDCNNIWQPALLLAEIVNPVLPLRNNTELAFLAKRFAPAELLSNEALAELLSETLESVTA